jgi:hypothetical protein
VNWLIDCPLAPVAPARGPIPSVAPCGRRGGLRALAFGISLAAHVAIYSLVDFNGGAVARPAHDAAAATNVMTVGLLPANLSGDARRETGPGLSGRAAAEPRHAAESLPPATRIDTAALLSLPAPQRPHYFPVSQLTQKPLVLRDIPSNLTLDVPDAPAHAAVLRLLINEAGDIDKVIVDEVSVPEHAVRAISEAFRNIRFRPGEKDGAPVKSQLKIQIMLESMVQPPSGIGAR